MDWDGATEWSGFGELHFYKTIVVCQYLTQQALSGGMHNQAAARMKDYKYSFHRKSCFTVSNLL